jgi:hypothetical protein
VSGAVAYFGSYTLYVGCSAGMGITYADDAALVSSLTLYVGGSTLAGAYTFLNPS